MVRILFIGTALLVGLISGLALTYVTVSGEMLNTAYKSGSWRSWSAEGTQTFDPYSWAILSQRNEVPFDSASSIEFRSKTDINGDALRTACQYIVSGKVPQARIWTLSSVPLSETAAPQFEAQVSLSSRQVQYQVDGGFRILVNKDLSSGNWLAVKGDGQFELILRLYQTWLATSVTIQSEVLPEIEPVGDCA